MPSRFLLTCSQPHSARKQAKRAAARLPKSCLAFFVRSLPGQYYIWAPDQKTFMESLLSHNMRIPDSRITFVPPEETAAVFRCRNGGLARSVTIGDWVTISQGVHQGDYAIVRDVTDERDLVKVAVVPRISSDGADRPERQLVDRKWLEHMYPGEKAEDAGPDAFKFRNKLFVSGLLVMSLPSLHSVRPARPSLQDILEFCHTDMGAFNGIEPFLRRGDMVVVCTGSLRGMAGTVADISEESVNLEQVCPAGDSPIGELRRGEVQRLQEAIETDWPRIANMSCVRREVRRILEPGDNIIIKLGPRQGQDGIIIAVENHSLLIHIGENEPFVRTDLHSYSSFLS